MLQQKQWDLVLTTRAGDIWHRGREGNRAEEASSRRDRSSEINIP